MDKILSARIDEGVIRRVEFLSRKLHTSKKAVIEAAILSYAQKIEEENEIDILEQTFGSWVREESRDAMRVNETQRHTGCTHRYRPNQRGGGTCDCGDEVYRDEL